MWYLIFTVNFILFSSTSSFNIGLPLSKTVTNMHLYGFIDNIKLIFSKEGQENIQNYNENNKQEQLELQNEILER